MMPRKPSRVSAASARLNGHDLGIDPRLAHPAGNQLGVLGPEIDNENVLGHGAIN
jgi:hypothetical protein